LEVIIQKPLELTKEMKKEIREPFKTKWIVQIVQEKE
jgi:hypothetical protein